MSEDFVAVAKAEKLAPGQIKWVAVDRVRLVLANVDGQFYAIRDACGHKNAPLSRGRLDGCMIECPLHFAIFDVRTGKFVDGPIWPMCRPRGANRGRRHLCEARELAAPATVPASTASSGRSPPHNGSKKRPTAGR